ncbi:MAG: hypothetical protein ACI32N_02635 [Bulleidia sp.]
MFSDNYQMMPCSAFHLTIRSACLPVMTAPTDTIPQEMPGETPLTKSYGGVDSSGPKNRCDTADQKQNVQTVYDLCLEVIGIRSCLF